MRSGLDAKEIRERVEQVTRDAFPLTTPIWEIVHRRFLAHFIEQRVIGELESEESAVEPDRVKAAIVFADLAGYTRLTEEAGEEEALTAVERFVAAVSSTLPQEARIVKTIGDEVMVVGSNVTALAKWAVRFQLHNTLRPRPRIGLHSGSVIYRDGDFFGREVNRAARVSARAAGGEVLVTDAVVKAVGKELNFELIGHVQLKGFTKPTELYVASSKN